MDSFFIRLFYSNDKNPEKILALVYAHSYASLPIIVVTVMYIKVFRALGKRKRELKEAGITKEMRSKVVLDRERRMVLTILIVLALFYMLSCFACRRNSVTANECEHRHDVKYNPRVIFSSGGN